MLGVEIPERRLEDARNAERARRRLRNAAPASDGDGEFAFIAGYTEEGAPFGIRRDELDGEEVEDAELEWD